MFLACDIGNTNTKLALFLRDELKNFSIIPNDKLDFSFLKENKFTDASISSVVPKLTIKFTEFFQNENSVSPFIITKDSKFNLTIDYETPETLGIDRICSAEGALSLLKKPNLIKHKKYFIISVDFGTATTINVVTSENKFIGGIIAPGVETMFNSLHKGTAQLPKVSTNDYKNIIGSSTISSISSGVINSQIGLLEKIYNHLEELSADEIYIYVTGGNAKKIIPYINYQFSYVEELVLHGIKSIYERNKID